MLSDALRASSVLGVSVVLALAGCAGDRRESAPPASEAAAVAVTLGDEAQRVYDRSLVRDPAPTCAELTEGVSDPVAALLEVADRAALPPMSGMRAAACLVREHAAQVEPVLTRWVSERRTMGFGFLVLDSLDLFDDALAQRLVGAALSGELALEARPRIARSARHAHLLGEIQGTTGP